MRRTSSDAVAWAVSPHWTKFVGFPIATGDLFAHCGYGGTFEMDTWTHDTYVIATSEFSSRRLTR